PLKQILDCVDPGYPEIFQEQPMPQSKVQSHNVVQRFQHQEATHTHDKVMLYSKDKRRHMAMPITPISGLSKRRLRCRDRTLLIPLELYLLGLRTPCRT